MGPERVRIAAVLGVRQGSGYLLTPRLVLTAGHLVENRYRVSVAALGGVGEVKCRVVWARHDRECDAALLLAQADLLPPEAAESLEPVRWGVPSGLEPMTNCQAIGFPQVQRDTPADSPDGVADLDTEQIVGTFKPGSRMVRARYVLDSAHAPPKAPRNGVSPWAGMSGAALFADGLIIGVVVTDPEQWRHGRLEAIRSQMLFGDPDFVERLVKHTGHQPAVDELSVPDHRPHAEFERRYCDYIAEYHSELTIFGLDFSRQEHAQWPLDTAYLSLELAPHHSAEGGEPAAVPGLFHQDGGAGAGRQRVEAAFSRRTRILVRGQAGSGKTTLVQWLAVTAARGEFPEGLGHLQGCLPFVLPLRTLARRDSLPGPEEFLSAVGSPLGTRQPTDWADQVLRSGRGLLLIDGVDEVGEQDRRRTREWLRGLIAAYPDCVYLVTTRPSAVDDGWLGRQLFTELNLLPMNRRDVTAFLHRWHRAAAATVQRPQERARLEEYEQKLAEVLPRKGDLARLATNPLMCAMVCALNRDRRAYLPQNRLELYDAALSMLLVRRDREREVTAQPEIHESAQLWLLEQLAYWMIRNGHAEADRSAVLRVVGTALRSMPQLAEVDTADGVLEHLLLRSGLLRAPTPDSVEFVHRTFQDYLGARAAVEGQDLGLIAAHAHEPQWEDVVRMAVGHARPAERALLLGRLVARGDEAESPQRERLHLLAAACLEHATALDPAVRVEVEQRARELVPPETTGQAELLARAGAVVLDLLPGPEDLTDHQANAVVHTAQLLGGEHSFQVLRRFREHPSAEVRQALADAWSGYDAKAYAEEVLAPAGPLTDVLLTVQDEAQLAALDKLAPVPRLRCLGSFGAGQLAGPLSSARPTALVLDTNDTLDELSFLSSALPDLDSLGLVDCGGLTDYSALAALGVRWLRLENQPHGPDLSPIREMRELLGAEYAAGLPGAHRPLAELPLPAQLRELRLTRLDLGPSPLHGLERWPRLGLLELSETGVPARALAPLAGLGELRSLRVEIDELGALDPEELPACPGVRDLRVSGTLRGKAFDTGCLRAVFPGVSKIQLALMAESAATVDVTALADLPPDGVRVIVFSTAPVALIGAECLPDRAITVYRTEPVEPQPTRRFSRFFGGHRKA